MFGRAKRKIVEDIKEEARDQFYESANSGIIHTGAVAVECLLFLGLMFTGGCGSHSSGGDNIHIHIHND